jgi:hypothetical protein
VAGPGMPAQQASYSLSFGRAMGDDLDAAALQLR